MNYPKRMPSPSQRQASSETYWIPNTDVLLAAGNLVITVELAGIRREDLELTAERSQLKISGHRLDGSRGNKCKFLIMEINYGTFESIIEIPEGYDLGQARAVYQNGFLRIEVPQHNGSGKKPHQVPISGGD